ncbi:MAG: hypothetical protein LBI49_02180 [Nocardiopsaceae bacterium]|jgi:hypothetical protein|nr:hypothetical protein [Nocardiopsaceae bacterium]
MSSPAQPARLPPAAGRTGAQPPGRSRRGIPLLLAASGWIALGITAIAGHDPFRFLVVLGFTLVCPGAAVARLLPLRSFLERAVLSVALGLSLAAIVSEAVAIGRILDPAIVLVILASLCTGAAAVDLGRGFRTS